MKSHRGRCRKNRPQARRLCARIPAAGCKSKANTASGFIITATPRGCGQKVDFLRCSLGQDRQGIAPALHA